MFGRIEYFNIFHSWCIELNNSDYQNLTFVANCIRTNDRFHSVSSLNRMEAANDLFTRQKYRLLWSDLCVIKSIIRPYLCWWSCPLIAVRGFTFTCAHKVNSLWRSIRFEIRNIHTPSTLPRKYANWVAIHFSNSALNQQSISVSKRMWMFLYFLINSCGDCYVFGEFSRCEHGTIVIYCVLTINWQFDVPTRKSKTFRIAAMCAKGSKKR